MNNSSRRVVVTGLGLVSPIGCSVKKAWSNLLNGHCGITKLTEESYEKLPCRIAGKINTEDLDLNNFFSKSELKTISRGTSFALIAAKEALTEAQWFPEHDQSRDQTGVAIGMGMVDLNDICDTNDALRQGYNRVSPFFVPRILPNMPAGQVSIKYGFKGPNHSVSTACATGAHSVGDAFRFIKSNDADVMVCGGAEACISPLGIAGFCRLRALCTSHNDDPTTSSRPFDVERDGFVMGEGSAIIILEELKHAQERGAHMIAEILGYGLSADASHITSPCENGSGAMSSMKRSIKNANIDFTQIGYVNAHATSTKTGDSIEARAIMSVFNDHIKNIAISSTKGAHGHLLGAAGNLETLFTILACQTGRIPPTINMTKVNDEFSSLNFVPNYSQEWPSSKKRRIALKNSFGFGGTNATLCIAQFEE